MNINIPKNNLYTCSEYPIVLFLKYINRYSDLLWCSSLNFSLNDFSDYIGIDSDQDVQWLLESLYNIYNIKINHTSIQDFSSIQREICNQLNKGTPVIVFINAYWCPWLMAYKKGKKTPHYIMISGMTEQAFVCNDMMIDTSEYLPFQDFREGAQELITFEVLPYKQQECIDIMKHVLNALLRIRNEKNDIYTNMNIFANSMHESFDIHNSIQGYEPYKYAPLFTWLKGISTAREKYSLLLDELVTVYSIEELKRYVPCFMNISKEWRHISIMLFKSVYSNNAQRIYNNIEKIIKGLSDTEKKAVDEIIDILKKRVESVYQNY